MSVFDLSGRVAMITGCGRGIGAEIARAFGRAGASLALNWYRSGGDQLSDLERDLAAQGTEFTCSEGDVSDPEYIVSWCQGAYADFDKIDILVNVAGILRTGRIEEYSVDDWEDLMRVNFMSVFMLSRELIPGMISNRYGRIINLASQHGQVGAANKSLYAASKAAVIGFTKSVAREVGPFGITANCIAPGPVETEMVAYQTRDERVETCGRLPLRRFSEVGDVADSALFLASSAGDAYTGQTLGPNSGDVML